MRFKWISMLPHLILVGGVWLGYLSLARYTAQGQFDDEPFAPSAANASRHFAFPKQPEFQLRAEDTPPDLPRNTLTRIHDLPVRPETVGRTDVAPRSFRPRAGRRTSADSIGPRNPVEPPIRIPPEWRPADRSPIARFPVAPPDSLPHDTGDLQRPRTSPRRFDADERSSVELFREASPSVVNIDTRISVPAQSRGLGAESRDLHNGSGSGVIWDQEGHIVTNYHVIRDADRARVTLSDGTEVSARLVGTAPDFDIAVLQIAVPSKQLKPLAVGRSDDLAVGQKVYAIGNPFGFEQTLTTGIVSGLGRKIPGIGGQPIEGVVQTDAAINPGNSGGPLLDSQGRLIGINTAIFSPSGASAGVSFAVPVDSLVKAVPELIRRSAPPRPSLGIATAPSIVMEQLGIQGVLVLRVSRGSPADRAGLRATRLDADGNVQLGDIILSLNGEPIRDVEELTRELGGYRPGDTIVMGLERDERPQRVPVQLDAI